MNKVTVLVNSCDSYEEIWTPFFILFKKYWPSCEYPIVLNTESKEFDFSDLNIKTFQLYQATNKKIPWGERLIKTLEKIDSQYIIFLLDDFFFTDYVDVNRLNQCIEWMDENSDIATFGFTRTHQPNIQDNKFPNFEKRPQEGEYRLNTQAAIWRKEKLISYIKPHESAWDWELLGSIRSSRYKERFYSAIEGKPYIFVYDSLNLGLRRGKWLKDNIDFFEKENIAVDFSRRGFWDDSMFDRKMSIKEKVIYKINYRIKKFKSLR